MIAKLDAKRDYPCDAHIVALAYLVRFDPRVARQRLKHEFPGECSGDLLRFISELTLAPVLNDQAVANLDSTEPQTVRDAVEYLTSYGNKEDEAPLWRRYVRWTATYEGKANLLDHRGNDWYKSFDSSIMGEELGTALIRGQGWFADAGLIARVLKRCVGKQMCERLTGDTEQVGPPYEVNLPDFADSPDGVGTQNIRVAQYRTNSLELFEAKISQFPPESQFILQRDSPSNSDERKFEAQVRTIIEKHGMSLDNSKD